MHCLYFQGRSPVSQAREQLEGYVDMKHAGGKAIKEAILRDADAEV